MHLALAFILCPFQLIFTFLFLDFILFHLFFLLFFFVVVKFLDFYK